MSRKKRLKLIRHAYLIVPKVDQFLHKMSCLAECPVSSKYFEQKKEPDIIITYTCVEKCKKIHIVNQQHVR